MGWLELSFTILTFASLARARRICPFGTQEHVTNYSERQCCIAVFCDPGFESRLCENIGDEALCVPCPEGKYMSTSHWSRDMRLCQIKRACDDGQSVFDERGTTEDRVCQCDLDKGFYNKSVGDPCIRKRCEAGMELTSDGRCKPCRSGYFKPEANYEPCLKKKDCDHKYASHGNATHDVVCKEKDTPKGSDTHTATQAPIVKESKQKDNHSFDWRKVVVIVISIIIVLVVVIIILVWCLYKSKRNCNPPADPREEKGMLPGSSTSSTPDSSLSYEMNRAECNAQYGPPSSVFSSLTASSLPDNASTHTVEVDNMPLEHQEQGTKQKYLWPLNSSPDSGVNLLETDCVPSMEDEETLPKVDTLKDPLDSAEKSLPNGPSLKGKIKTNVPSQPPLHINKVKNCNIFIQCGDNNRLYQNPVPSSSFSDSEDEHANYDLREEVAEEEDVSV